MRSQLPSCPMCGSRNVFPLAGQGETASSLKPESQKYFCDSPLCRRDGDFTV